MSRTSAKLRQAAHNALHEFQRPFTIPEFETWLGSHEPVLWKEISRKCDDYVRVILSLTPETTFVKYRCIGASAEPKRRATYYGAPDGQYDPAVWAFLSKKARRHREPPESHAPSEAPTISPDPSPEKSLFFGEPVYKPFNAQVDEKTCEYAWFALRTLMPSQHAFWTELARAVTAMRVKVDEGNDPDAALREILAECSSLTHGAVAGDAAQILSWEAIRTREQQGDTQKE
jgi:hypothetical protein